MTLQYGVLRARFDRAKREDGLSTPHLQIRALDSTGQPWRGAVNVQSQDHSEVVFWIVDSLVGHPIVDSLSTRPSGFSPAAPNETTSVDYVRAPLFDFSLGRVLPPSGSANADDLQDLLGLYLDQCKAAGGELFTFGMKFDSNRHLPIDAEFGNTDGLHGVHDIHMMQGNVGEHAGDNGAFRDGALLLAFPDRIVGIFLAFQTQRIPTDGNGRPRSDAKPLSSLIAPGPPTPVTPTGSAGYLQRALITPAGADPGHEVVVLGNCATTPHKLAGWQLVDRNGRITDLDIEIGAGASALVPLDGTGVQLGNGGGNVVLRDEQGDQVDSVTYSAQEPGPSDRFIRFRRQRFASASACCVHYARHHRREQSLVARPRDADDEVERRGIGADEYAGLVLANTV